MLMFLLIFFVPLALDLAVAVWYAREGHPDMTMKAFWLKMVASGIFVLHGLFWFLAVDSRREYAKFVMLALALGMVGDALLSFEPFLKGEHKKRNTLIILVIGAGVFLAGHIMYIVAFIREFKALGTFKPAVFLIAWAVIWIAALIAKKFSGVRLGKLAYPMLVYSLGLSAMGAQSICMAICSFPGDYLLKGVMLLAPTLFIVSDSSLGLKFADRERFGTLQVRYVTLITYYTAQMLFGLSIMLTASVIH
jgi:uncharacterized membrane protein YhhN